MTPVDRFVLDIPDSVLSDLQRRLDHARWPEQETVADWSQGAPLAKVQALCEYWRTGYDWRRCEAMLNGFGQFTTEIDGLKIHFLHIRSPEPDALPLLMTHGWPGSVIEFHKVIGPLTDPVAHGGNAADAFHLILPSLPGYGFSGKPARTGQGVQWTAHAWTELMRRLGYDRYVAQGGDWGATVATAIGAIAPPECLAIHLNMPIAFPDMQGMADWTPEEAASAAATAKFLDVESGYSTQQRTRPQTLGYGLADSPVGQAAWIYEKFFSWTDCDGEPESVLTQDQMLDNIMLYWLTNSGASSARLYWESMLTSFDPAPVEMPTGISLFPKEVIRPSRRWAEKTYKNVIYWNEPERGGHFAAFEQPEIFTSEIRNCFRQIR
jgi:pimeloyl-ACP methyl ester carboxylesterase